MEITQDPKTTSVIARALSTNGRTSTVIYQAVCEALNKCSYSDGTLVDLGCGHGTLWRYVSDRFSRYVGVDIVKYDGLPEVAEFYQTNLNDEVVPLLDGYAILVSAIETIHHLENPHAFMREATRLTKPGGRVIVTTRNRLSLLSKLSLVFRNRFDPSTNLHLQKANLCAPFASDLVRIAEECGLIDIYVGYTDSGRIPFTRFFWPRRFGFRGPLFSDNVILSARKPT